MRNTQRTSTSVDHFAETNSTTQEYISALKHPSNRRGTVSEKDLFVKFQRTAGRTYLEAAGSEHNKLLFQYQPCSIMMNASRVGNCRHRDGVGTFSAAARSMASNSIQLNSSPISVPTRSRCFDSCRSHYLSPSFVTSGFPAMSNVGLTPRRPVPRLLSLISCLDSTFLCRAPWRYSFWSP